MSKNLDVLAIMPHKWNIFPFGLGILLSILKDANFDVDVLDAGNKEMTPIETAEQIAVLKPKIIFFGGLLTRFSFIKEVSNLTRDRFPKATQVAGGWWARTIPTIVFDETSVDYVVRGQPDNFIAEFCQKIIENKSVSDFPGICSRLVDKKYRIQAPCPSPRKLDELPLPAYELFNMDYYFWTVETKDFRLTPFRNGSWFSPYFPEHDRYQKFRNKKTLKWAAMYSGRGCYGLCTFCTAFNMTRRNYAPEYVVDHMEKMVKEHGVDIFDFTESLTLSTKIWVKKFCNELISRNLDCLYVAFSRGDINYDDEMLDLLSKSGCHAVRIGFESGDDMMLRNMNKKVKVERYRKLVNKLHEYNMLISASFIFNMPGESQESLDKTVEFIKESKLYDFDYGFATPYPETPLYDFAMNNGFIKNERDYVLNELGGRRLTTGFFNKKGMDRYVSMFNFNNLSSQQLLSLKDNLEVLRVINRAYFANRKLYHLLNRMPFLAKIFVFRHFFRARLVSLIPLPIKTKIKSFLGMR